MIDQQATSEYYANLTPAQQRSVVDSSLLTAFGLLFADPARYGGDLATDRSLMSIACADLSDAVLDQEGL